MWGVDYYVFGAHENVFEVETYIFFVSVHLYKSCIQQKILILFQPKEFDRVEDAALRASAHNHR
jgi:hypothetical protein